MSDKIQDSENNYTRFFCVAKDPVIYAGANRISLILSFENKPGALYEILSKLAALDINMTKLESCPVAGSDFEFVFFLELEASVQDPSVLAMLEEKERWAESSVTAGRRPSTPRSAVRTIASSSWSRRSWARSSRGRTSAG